MTTVPPSEHSSSPTTYYVVFGSLIVLTLLTVGVSFIPVSEPWHTLLGLGIATLKGTLVILFFMHVYHSTPLTRIFAATGFVFLLILIAFTAADYVSRTWLNNMPAI